MRTAKKQDRKLDSGRPPQQRVRVRVIGPHRVHGIDPGETGEVTATQPQLDVLVGAGHVELAPDPPTEPPAESPPDNERPKKTRKPRQSAGLSHAQDTAAAADTEQE